MWKSTLSDRCVIDIVKHGLKVDFATMPENDYVPVMSFDDEEKEISSEELNKLSKKGVILECNKEKGDFFLISIH